MSEFLKAVREEISSGVPWWLLVWRALMYPIMFFGVCTTYVGMFLAFGSGKANDWWGDNV